MRTVALLGALLGGCTYGGRGGPETLVYSGGPVLTQAAVTGFAGFGSTSRAGRNQGLAESATLAVGGDARNGGAAVSVLGGLEWFDVPERDGGRWGYRAGVEGGGRWRGPALATSELVVQVRGAAVCRLVDRDSSRAPLLTLGLEATLGMAATLDASDPGGTSFVGGLAVTVGATSIGPFHL
ncbi:MAG: hypothetical protein JWM10_953 [Myxococcaceae bacterium]|nr:hypothetical protein [Myxococcaceae bacterium]